MLKLEGIHLISYAIFRMEIQDKFHFQKTAAHNIDKDLVLITDEQIRIYLLLDNLKIIHRYACFDELDNLHRSILSLFQFYGEFRIEQLLRRTKEHSVVFLLALYDLIAKKRPTINWHKPVNEYTLVSVAR